MKRVPLPAAVSTLMFPWCAFTMPATMASPSPVPLVLVVNSGSKILLDDVLGHADAVVDHR